MSEKCPKCPRWIGALEDALRLLQLEGEKLAQRDADIAWLRGSLRQNAKRRSKLRNCRNKLGKQVHDLGEQNRDLRAIVAKYESVLPKTADGVTIVPGMRIWPVGFDKVAADDPPDLAQGLEAHIVLWSDEEDDWWEISKGVAEYCWFSTKEAAKAAQSELDT